MAHVSEYITHTSYTTASGERRVYTYTKRKKTMHRTIVRDEDVLAFIAAVAGGATHREASKARGVAFASMQRAVVDYAVKTLAREPEPLLADDEVDALHADDVVDALLADELLSPEANNEHARHTQRRSDATARRDEDIRDIVNTKGVF
jgi:hypothetical protein